MNITFISDQFYPRTSADSEQIVSSLTALNSLANVTLLSAKYAYRKEITNQDLKAYYGKNSEFNLSFINHLIPNIRGIEKLTFAIRSALKIKNSQCELVYTRNIPILISVLMFTSIPIVFETYRPWPNQNKLSHYFFSKISRVKKVIGIVLHSEFAKKSFLEVGFSASKLLVAHNAFDLKEYDVVDPVEVRRTYSLPEDKLITVYSGRVNNEKGLQRMLSLAGRFKDTFFLIVGSEGEGDIEKEAKIHDNVKVLGWMDKKAVFSILQASDILYIPPTLMAREVSKNTVLPLKTFIYKAAGRAILAPNSEDLCEVLTHNETAFLVDPDNDDEENKAFSTLINDNKLRDSLGKAAKEEMTELTWKNRATGIYNFIRSNL